jgi:hypothetical protein
MGRDYCYYVVFTARCAAVGASAHAAARTHGFHAGGSVHSQLDESQNPSDDSNGRDSILTRLLGGFGTSLEECLP